MSSTFPLQYWATLRAARRMARAHPRRRVSLPLHHAWPLCVTFSSRFSRTYKRTFPRFSVPVRAYTGLVSLSRIAASLHRFSPQTRTAPTHDRHKSCKRKKSRVSLYVTFDSARLARDSRDCIHPRHLDPSIPWPLFSPIVTLVLDAFCARMGATGGWRTARTEVRGSSKCGAYLWEFDDRVWNVDANYDVATHKGWRYSGGAKTAAIWGGATEEGRVLGSSLG